MNDVLTFTGALTNLQLLCLMYIVYILNITSNNSIGNIPPHQYSYGQTPNTSSHLVFTSMNTSTRKREMGWFCPQCWGILTIHILTDDTHCTIYCSAVCSTLIHHEKTFVLNSQKGG